MAYIGTIEGVRDWAASWLVGIGSSATFRYNLRGALRRFTTTYEDIRRDYPEAARELRTIILSTELEALDLDCTIQRDLDGV